jgi:hypothetical protein
MTADERLLRGRRLRYATAVALFDAQRSMTLEDLVAVLLRQGFSLPGEPRKVVSDALRWELHKGRAIRTGRGQYRSLGLARSTARWMRAQLV